MSFLVELWSAPFSRPYRCLMKNSEIGSLAFLRSQAYSDYFEYLDKAGGFSYERWGDAPVHSLAASIFLNTSDM
jgi:alpha 1,2-mannosyltransferase